MTTDRPTAKGAVDDPLYVHVLGADKGESIVLQLPNGDWGVVDCYARDLTDPRGNPTVQFLRENGVGELAFVCLTHPHDDHYRGMEHLFQCFDVREFWRFSIDDPSFSALLERELVQARRRREADAVEGYESLLATLRVVRDLRLRRGLVVSRPSKLQVVYAWPPEASPGDLFIQVVAPSLRYQENYTQRMERARAGDEAARPRPNDISLALLVVYGESQILLGGDVEERNWEHVVREEQRTRGPRLPFARAQAIKVCHHGSPNGHHDDIWARCSTGRHQPVAVVTSYSASGLPSTSGIERILTCTPKIYVTNVAAVPERTRRRFAFHEDQPARSRRLLREGSTDGLVGLVPADPRYGRCSLQVDRRGRVHVKCAGPAGRYRPTRSTPSV